MRFDGTANRPANPQGYAFRSMFTSVFLTAGLLAGALLAPSAAQAGQLGDCAAEYTSGQGGLNCTANDDSGSIIPLNEPPFCTAGEGVTFDVATTFTNSTSANRYDARFWVSSTGKDPKETGDDGGPTLCSLSALPIGAAGVVTDEEAFPGQDTCGDIAPASCSP